MRTLFILSALITVFFSKSQVSWFPPGAVWHYSLYSPGFPQVSGVNTFSYTGDTTFGAVNCKIISKRFVGINQWIDVNNTVVENFSPYYFTYENNGVTYLRNTDGSKYDTIVNFKAAIGDKWLLVSYSNPGTCSTSSIVPKVVVKDTNHVTINGFYLKRIVTSFTLNSTVYNDTLIERIGGRTNFWYPETCRPVDALSNGSFMCYQDNTFPLYKKSGVTNCNYEVGIRELANNNSVKLFPNPSSRFVNVEVTDADAYANRKVIFQVLNSLGSILKTDELIFEGKSLSYDTGSLPDGIYSLKIELEGKPSAMQLLVILNR